MRSLINHSFAKKLGLTIQSLALPLEVEGCNNTIFDHIEGRVDVGLKIGNHEEAMTLWTMNLVDDASILLGYNWFTFHSPTIKSTIDKAWGVVHNKHKKKDVPDPPRPDPTDPFSQESLSFTPLGQDTDRKRYWVVDGTSALRHCHCGRSGPRETLYA